MSLMKHVAVITAGAVAVIAASGADTVVFPPDPGVKNVKTVFGAVGDGKADDTKALTKAFTTTDGVVYLPNGIYRVTGSIVCRGLGIGPWIFGQSREGVIIRLDDNTAGFDDPGNPQAVIAATKHVAGNRISADQFCRQWHNFTVDAGNNPGAIGIRYYGNNTSVLNKVTITGQGVIGLDLGWVDQNGPCLIRDVLIVGFGIGLDTRRTINSQTVSGLTIRDSRNTGLLCRDQNLSIEDLVVENVPLAVDAAGVVCIINATLSGIDGTSPAIRNGGHLYCRNVSTRGFSRAIESPEGGVKGPTVTEYVSEAVVGGFERHRGTSLSLPIKKPPVVPWEEDLSKWVCVNDFGAVGGDGKCDAGAFQAAIDTAAAQGKTTVYIRAVTGSDPNWYTLSRDVFVHGSVRHILGLGFARILSKNGLKGFVLRRDAAPVVKFQNLYSFGGAPRSLVTNDESTVIVEDCDGIELQASGRGDVFINNSVGTLRITSPDAHVWARQWNTEGAGIDTENRGGTLWILGLKTEKGALKIRTADGGRTELLGAHIYNICTQNSPHPLFEIVDASATFACVREVVYCGKEKWYTEHVRETRMGETRTWLRSDKVWTLYCATGEPSPQPRSVPKAEPPAGIAPVRRWRRSK